MTSPEKLAIGRRVRCALDKLSVATWSAIALLAAGCSTVSDVVVETASHDLRCPKSDVRAEPIGSFFGHRYLAAGCGHYLKYVCYPVGKASFKCFPDQPPQLHDIRELDAGAEPGGR